MSGRAAAVPTFAAVQRIVSDVIKGRVLIGHDLRHDFKALMLDHPRRTCRDTARFKPLQGPGGRPRSLKNLTKEVLGMDIQSAEHSPVEDARCTMMLYRQYQRQWEHDAATKNKLFRNKGNSFRPRPGQPRRK